MPLRKPLGDPSFRGGQSERDFLHAAKVRSSCEEGPGQSALHSAYHDPHLDVTDLKQNRTTLSFRSKIANKQIIKKDHGRLQEERYIPLRRDRWRQIARIARCGSALIFPALCSGPVLCSALVPSYALLCHIPGKTVFTHLLRRIVCAFSLVNL